jgi:hypothetical protein
MDLNFSQPFESSRVSYRAGRINVQAASTSKVQVSLDQFHNDIGFKDPLSLKSFIEQQSRSKVSSATTQAVSEGNQFLDRPSSATVSQARNSGIYSVSAPLGSGRRRPQISFSSPGAVRSNFSRAEVSVTANPNSSANFDYRPMEVSLDRRASLQISLVPHEAAGFQIDVRA